MRNVLPDVSDLIINNGNISSQQKITYTPPTFASATEEREWLKFRLAQAFRIFAQLGYDEGVAGHITVRDNMRPDCFWVNPFGLHFSLIQPSDLILVDHSGQVCVDESGPHQLLNKAAFAIHSTIHTNRPDVLCAAHSHSIHGRAFSTLGVELDMITQDSCAFYKDHAVYRQFRGVVLDEEEGRNITEALGSRKAAILQNHGLLVAAGSIEATVFYFSSLEKCCKAQLLADAAAGGRGIKTIKIADDEAEATHNVIGGEKFGRFSGLPLFHALEAREGRSFEFQAQ
ncbi:class II aldolase/adducin domain-containing protein [Athelia psychrophila]|uniref:Class II aldolase/adducin domain-containing protein n=1 Tax=Athelia psychrophila TaxID=1759441 RepID=A0A166NAG0_9AGAM|nr:class II aldolase/adducin domain-containing protein [Fibularhizoctonia sp. CBS 109695]